MNEGRMKRRCRIVYIGAGSVCFAPTVLNDFFSNNEISGSTLVLMDKDLDRLNRIKKYALFLQKKKKVDYYLKFTTNLENALQGADFVIISVAINRMDFWEKDHALCNRYSFYQIQGENGGPAGFSHTLRNVPLVLEICRKIEKVCPKAFVFNFTNPESRIITAIERYTKLKSVGLCHGSFYTVRWLEYILQLPEFSCEAKIHGLNHFSWVYELIKEETGKSLLESLPNAIKKRMSWIKRQHKVKSLSGKDRWDFGILSCEAYELFGQFPCGGDTHICEFMPYYEKETWKRYNMKQWDKLKRVELMNKRWEILEEVLSGKIDLEEFQPSSSSVEIVVDLITSMVYDKNKFFFSLNIPNRGSIPNLPYDSVVEIGGIINSQGIHGICTPPLPATIGSLCQRVVTINELIVKAAAEGDKRAALEAMLLDPYINDTVKAKKLLDDILLTYKEYLPTFR